MLKRFIAFSLILAATLTTTSLAYAQAGNSGNYGLNDTAEKAQYKQPGQQSEDIYQLIGRGIALGLELIGLVFFILTLYAGFRWMTARGNEEFVTKAKDILEAAVIGLIIVLLSYGLTRFIFGRLGA